MKDERRIMLVDDDPDILDLLKYNLEREGFHVRTIENSLKAIRTAEKFVPDLIILDLMMPEIDGLKLCQQLRVHPQLKDVYIFFLTAKTGGDFQEIVLSKGADDYIEKMMGIRSLMSKVNCVLKKKLIIRKSVQQVSLGELTMNRETYNVTFKDSNIDLNITEFEILFFFVQNPGKRISMDILIESLSNSEIYLIEGTVRLYVQNIRRKLGAELIKALNQHDFQLSF